MSTCDHLFDCAETQGNGGVLRGGVECVLVVASGLAAAFAVDETVSLLHPPLRLAGGVSTAMERKRESVSKMAELSQMAAAAHLRPVHHLPMDFRPGLEVWVAHGDVAGGVDRACAIGESPVSLLALPLHRYWKRLLKGDGGAAE